jgi:hypothetical protein
MILGIDTLAAVKYPKKVFKHVPPGWALGVFWDTFGPAKPFITKAAKKGKWPIIRIQGIWQDSHTFTANDFTNAIKIGGEVMELQAKFPSVQFRYSPFCEHRLPKSKMVPLLESLKTRFPDLLLVNTAISGGETVGADLAVNEFHGLDVPGGAKNRYEFSFDGTHCVDADIEMFKSRYSAAEVFWFWVWQMNLKMSGKDKTPRIMRKVRPTKKLFKSLEALGGEKIVDTLDKKWLYKSHAEQVTVDEGRGNRAIILGPKEGKVEVVASGKKIASFAASGKHENDFIYRSAFFGYELQNKARKAGTDGRLQVVVDDKSMGFVDPVFRCGKSFRNKE